MSKIVIFGIDGGSLELIERWKDELPNLKQIMDRGVFGELESTIPAMTCPAWPSMFTGKNPGKLGMYGFLSYPFAEGPDARLFTSSDYHTLSLWKILNDCGRQVGLLNLPLTFPPHKIDSFMVCGFGTPRTANTNCTYPPELKKTLDKVAGGYEVLPPVMAWIDGKQEEHLKAYRAMLDKRARAAEYLMREYPWDLFVCQFQTLDGIQHYFWRYMDSNHPRHVGNSKYKDAIRDFYRRIDQAVGSLIRETPEDTNILIASDHGFRASPDKSFSISRWLEETGFLRIQTRVRRKRLTNAALRRLRDLLGPRLNPRLLRAVARLTPDRIARRLVGKGSKDVIAEIIENVDWAGTKAYSLGGMIFINLKGRQPGGTVEPGKEYEEVRDKIIEGLSKVVDPETGKPAGFTALRREDIYCGQYVNLAPDIVVLAEKHFLRSERGSLWARYHRAVSGNHARQGVFMACGPDIKRDGAKLAGLRIYDIAPTVLHMFGLPVPDDMDGRVLVEIFREGSEPAQREVKYQRVDLEREKIRDRITNLKRIGSI